MAQDTSSTSKAGPSPERRFIDAAFEQELGSPAEPSLPFVFGEAGSLLASNEDIPSYEITREIHRGGQGVVYQAAQKSTGRTVAIKVMREGPFAGAADKARFEREVQILAALDHPNIVTILDSGLARGSFYFVMTYVPGEPLDQYVSRYAPNLDQLLRLFTKICAAVNAAHLQGVIHRDLKPGNIRVDANGEPHILDFGLARRTPGFSDAESAMSGMTMTGQFMGSLPWASPEQAEGAPGKIDIRTDVYSLGVILYQMLTGRFPYVVAGNMRDILENILKAEPTRPSTIRRQINDEVETIVLKCLSKERERRYQTAGELSRDIVHYLNGEPIEAKRDSALYMLTKYMRRYRTRLVLVVIFFVFAASATSMLVMYNQQARLAEQRERFIRRENLIQKLTFESSSPRREGWSGRAWEFAGEIAKIQPDAVARDHAAATLADFDARLVKPPLTGIGASALAFDAEGKHLLLGSLDADGDLKAQDAKLLDIRAGTHAGSMLEGSGRVAFRADGTPVQLVVSGKALRVWDVAARKLIREWGLPTLSATPSGGEAILPVTTLSADGSLVAAAFRPKGDEPVLVVWNCESGEEVHRRVAEATALAFTPDGTLLAAGDTDGRVSVWALGSEETTLVPQVTRTTVHCLAFAHSPTVSGQSKVQASGPQWLLAAGYSGGSIVRWDLVTNSLLAWCRGSAYDVFAVDLSPDGTLLASAGRGWTQLWDAASGQSLLLLAGGDYTSAIRFSPDGSMLAAATQGAGKLRPRQLYLWTLDNGRGVRALRRLAAPIVRVHFSPDGQLAAAISHDWRVGVWDIGAQVRLLHVLDPPRGLLADNAALAFSPDHSLLAFSTGHIACLWEVSSGHLLEEWPLYDGLCDVLAFPENDRVLSFRVETKDRNVLPVRKARPTDYPRICRIRSLRRGESTPALVKEIKDFNWHVYTAAIPPSGAYIAVDGLGGLTGEQRMIKIFDAGGNELPSPQSSVPPEEPGLIAWDATGRYVTLTTEEGRSTLFEMPGLKQLGPLMGRSCCLSRNAEYWAAFWQSSVKEPGIALHGGPRHNSPLVTLGANTSLLSGWLSFSDDGRLLARGAEDGTVYVWSLSQVRQRLAQLGLDWQD